MTHAEMCDLFGLAAVPRCQGVLHSLGRCWVVVRRRPELRRRGEPEWRLAEEYTSVCTACDHAIVTRPFEPVPYYRAFHVSTITHLKPRRPKP